jgi:hypothetical protein
VLITLKVVHKIKNVLKDAGIYYQVYTSRAIYTEDPQRDLDIYIDTFLILCTNDLLRCEVLITLKVSSRTSAPFKQIYGTVKSGAEVRDETFNVMSTSHLNKSLVHKIKNVLKDAGIYCQQLVLVLHKMLDLSR